MARSLDQLNREERDELGLLAQLVTKGWRDADAALHYARHPELKAYYYQLLDIDDWIQGMKQYGILPDNYIEAELVMAVLDVLYDDKTSRDELVDRLTST